MAQQRLCTSVPQPTPLPSVPMSQAEELGRTWKGGGTFIHHHFFQGSFTKSRWG